MVPELVTQIVSAPTTNVGSGMEAMPASKARVYTSRTFWMQVWRT